MTDNEILEIVTIASGFWSVFVFGMGVFFGQKIEIERSARRDREAASDGREDAGQGAGGDRQPDPGAEPEAQSHTIVVDGVTIRVTATAGGGGGSQQPRVQKMR